MKESISISLIMLIIFLLAVIGMQYEHNKALKKQLRNIPIKTLYMPYYCDCCLDEIEITEPTLLPEDYYDEVTVIDDCAALYSE